MSGAVSVVWSRMIYHFVVSFLVMVFDRTKANLTKLAPHVSKPFITTSKQVKFEKNKLTDIKFVSIKASECLKCTELHLTSNILTFLRLQLCLLLHASFQFSWVKEQRQAIQS